ncbi:hypothetical protein JCM10207_006867 [Rhodosporidiobolus poonsookiae]
MGVHADIAPPILFLGLYLAYFLVLLRLYSQKAIQWKSRFSFLLFHVTMRVTGMSLGIAFSVLDWTGEDGGPRKNVLIAYLVFSAEGYFSLILSAYRFLIAWQRARLGDSPLDPIPSAGLSRRERTRKHLRTPISRLTWGLITANALLIAGSGVMASSMSATDENDVHEKENTGKGLRVAGTAVFLVIVQVFLVLCTRSYRQRGNRTLTLIAATWPFLTVRGVYSIISVVIPEYSYSSTKAYTASGFTSEFLVGEHVMGSCMEWLACGLLIATHYSARNGGDELDEERGVDGRAGSADSGVALRAPKWTAERA